MQRDWNTHRLNRARDIRKLNVWRPNFQKRLKRESSGPGEIAPREELLVSIIIGPEEKLENFSRVCESPRRNFKAFIKSKCCLHNGGGGKGEWRFSPSRIKLEPRSRRLDNLLIVVRLKRLHQTPTFPIKTPARSPDCEFEPYSDKKLIKINSLTSNN